MSTSELEDQSEEKFRNIDLMKGKAIRFKLKFLLIEISISFQSELVENHSRSLEVVNTKLLTFPVLNIYAKTLEDFKNLFDWQSQSSPIFIETRKISL